MVEYYRDATTVAAPLFLLYSEGVAMIVQAAQTPSRAHAAERYIMPNMRLCAYSFDDDSRFGVIPGLILPNHTSPIAASDPIPPEAWPANQCVLLYGADTQSDAHMLARFTCLLSHVEFRLEFDQGEFHELCERMPECEFDELALECQLCIPPHYASTLHEEINVVQLIVAHTRHTPFDPA